MWLDNNRPDVPREGQRWGPFDIVKEIARGNMGVVFHARSQKGQDLALKILMVQHRDEDASERFKREAKSLARLAHPNIVSIHDYGVQGGIPFLTMDYVAGTTLQELLERAALPLSRSVALLAQIARGADHAHSRGVLHRDLKPANVLIGPDGAARITDFGLARITDASVSLTNDGDVIGTPVYMAPEQIQGTLAELGPPSDVWSLGVTLYLMLTGSLPFKGRTVDEVSRQVVQQDPAPPGALVSKLPEDLERICMTALDKDPRKRYQTAGELALDLEAYLKGKPVLAGKVTLGIRARRVGRFMRLHPRLLATAVAAALVLATVGLALDARSMDRATRSAQALVSLSAERRDKAWHALLTAQAALAKLETDAAVNHSRQADRELDWAAAYLARAGRLSQAQGDVILEAAVELRPNPDEVKGGALRDPALVGLRQRIQAIRSQAQAQGAPRRDDEQPAEVLIAAFQSDGDLGHLEALGIMAATAGSTELAARAFALASAAGPPPPTAQGMRLLRLRAELSGWVVGEDPRQQWLPHLEEPGALAGLAAELEAEWSLVRGDVTNAGRLLPPARRGEPPRRRLLRARLARARGDWIAQAKQLEPLLSRADTPGVLAKIESAEGLIDQGRSRRALAVLREFSDRSLPPHLLLREEIVTAVARWLSQPEQPDPFWRALNGKGRPLLGRLEAARAAVLHEPSVEPPELPGAEGAARIQRARDELTLAVLAPQVDDSLARVALRLLGLGLKAKASVETTETFRGLANGRPEALAAAMILYMDREDAAGAKALYDESRPTWRQHPSVLVANRLRSAAPSRTSSPFRVDAMRGEFVALPPRGLIEGQAALAYALQRGPAASPLGRQQALSRGLRALRLALRLDPFHPGARIARARIHLLRAAEPTLTYSADRARQRALGDAAVACAADPGSPAAWGVLCQALWIRHGPDQRALYELLLEPWVTGEGPSVEPHERSLLPSLPQLLDPRNEPSLLSRHEPAELRLLETLAAAQEREGAPPTFRGRDPEPQAAAEGYAGELARAELLLQERIELRTFLERPLALEPPDLERLDAAIRGQRAEAGAALVLRLIHSLPRMLEAEADERARLYQQGVADLAALSHRRPGPAWLGLRAALELWAGRVTDPSDLEDLLAWGWSGAFHDLLKDLAAGRKPPRAADELLTLEPFRRYLRRQKG